MPQWVGISGPITVYGFGGWYGQFTSLENESMTGSSSIESTSECSTTPKNINALKKSIRRFQVHMGCSFSVSPKTRFSSGLIRCMIWLAVSGWISQYFPNEIRNENWFQRGFGTVLMPWRVFECFSLVLAYIPPNLTGFFQILTLSKPILTLFDRLWPELTHLTQLTNPQIRISFGIWSNQLGYLCIPHTLPLRRAQASPAACQYQSVYSRLHKTTAVSVRNDSSAWISELCPWRTA